LGISINTPPLNVCTTITFFVYETINKQKKKQFNIQFDFLTRDSNIYYIERKALRREAYLFLYNYIYTIIVFATVTTVVFVVKTDFVQQRKIVNKSKKKKKNNKKKKIST